MIKNILLIQPRHIYSPKPETQSLGHIYMPTSLMAAGAILTNAGIYISILDENIEKISLNNNVIGINLLGAPYIPTALQYANSLRSKFDNDFNLIIGGQVVNGLKDNQILELFGENVFNGNNNNILSRLFNIEENMFKRIEEISLIPIYSKLSDYYIRLYLSHEFGFYLSQGCKYSCSFCSAQRSTNNPNRFYKAKETYRNLDIAYNDLKYLVSKAQLFGFKKLNIYLSNLDLFQTPSLLNQFADKILFLKSNSDNFTINLRGLSNVRSFLLTHKSNPSIIKKIVAAGLYRIGFGIDGATPRIWKETRKPQTKSECIEAIAIAKSVYGLTPETLMVFGYNLNEDEKSLKLAYDFTKDMYDNYNAIPRPHIAKDIIPGNDGWFDQRNKHIIDKFIQNPILFQNLDFTSLPSPYTHPNKDLRELIIKYFIKICDLPNALTRYVKPELPHISNKQLEEIKKFNLKRYDI